MRQALHRHHRFERKKPILIIFALFPSLEAEGAFAWFGYPKEIDRSIMSSAIFRYQLALLLPLFIAALTTAKNKIDIKNSLPDGQELKLHCKSKDDDLGNHVIPNGGHYDWSFEDNYFFTFWSTTLFTCNFECKFGIKNFTIYESGKTEILHWEAKEDGIHGYEVSVSLIGTNIKSEFLKWDKKGK